MFESRNHVKTPTASKWAPHHPPSHLPLSPSLPSQQPPAVYDDGTNTFFWQAHTVTVMMILVAVLVYMTFIEETSMDSSFNMRRGAITVVMVFILIGVIHMPNGPFVRPHPVLWRLVLCVAILYILALIFMLFQSIDDIQRFLKYIDPKLGVPRAIRTYAEDCRIYTPDNPNGSFVNIMEKLDMFVPCHFIGWWLKALILRDIGILMVLSFGFELLEYTFEVQLPNFAECWWDHWILDFILCNGVGIWLGFKTCEYFELKVYEWHVLWKIPTKSKLKKDANQFTPNGWTSFQWGYTQNFVQFIFISVMTAFWLFQELNTFYLSAIFWIPANHNLILFRQVYYTLCSACATDEMYDYFRSSDSNARIGRYSWLVFTTIIVEGMLEIKFGWDIVSIPVPVTIKLAWATFFAAFALWTFWRFTLPFRDMPFIGKYLRRLEGRSKDE